MASSVPVSISDHAHPADAVARRGFGPRVRRLHARIGPAHHRAEGMEFSRALLAGQASPRQLAALLRALAPAYGLIEAQGPQITARLGLDSFPWSDLARSTALRHDVARLTALGDTPASPAAADWLDRLQRLSHDAPHRFMAHVYVRYGGDLSGGQQLAQQAHAILAGHGLPATDFWHFERPTASLKQEMHAAFEQLDLNAAEEEEFLEEAVIAFQATQRLLAELGSLDLHPAATTPRPGDTVPLDLLLRHDRPVPRYTSYPTAASFHEGVGAEDLARQLAEPAHGPLSLYVHVPFCRHACWYCGCNRVTTQAGSKAVAPYLEALAKELKLIHGLTGERRRVTRMHWGGGTPNYLTSGEQRQLRDLIEASFTLEPDLEASIEVNPEFLSRDGVLEIRRLGFGRISFGIQDADPEVQRAVNRIVGADQLRRVMGWMREAAFRSVNVDLICGLPLQTPARFRRTLELVAELRPDRVSLFCFAYLPGQLPLQRRIRREDLPGQADRLTMLEGAHHLLLAAGYEAIGMDHYALADDSLAEAARNGRLHRNFQGYTSGGDVDLLGVGPTAISQFPHLFSQNLRQLRPYYRALEQGRLPVERGLVVRDPEVLERRALIREVMCHFRVELDPRRFATEWAELRQLESDGLVELRLPPATGGQGLVQVTPRGRHLLRTIAAVFDPIQRQRARGARLV